jgi:hypothetical protein
MKSNADKTKDSFKEKDDVKENNILKVQTYQVFIIYAFTVDQYEIIYKGHPEPTEVFEVSSLFTLSEILLSPDHSVKTLRKSLFIQHILFF